jgi:hypothetical protein
MEAIWLPVYYPSQEEKDDPKLYTSNVRRLMACEVCISLILDIERFETIDKLVAVYSSISKVIRDIVIRIMQSEVMNVVSFEFLELYPKLPYVPTIV